jgi:hypothetical protein
MTRRRLVFAAIRSVTCAHESIAFSATIGEYDSADLVGYGASVTGNVYGDGDVTDACE